MERSYEFDFAGRPVMMQVNPDNQDDWWDGPQAQLEIMYGIWVHMKDGAALRRRALTNFRLEDVKIGYVSGRCSHGRISYRDVELCPISGDAGGRGRDAGFTINRAVLRRALDLHAAQPAFDPAIEPVAPVAAAGLGWEIRAFPQPVGEVNVPVAARGAWFGAAQAQPAHGGGDGVALNAMAHPPAPAANRLVQAQELQWALHRIAMDNPPAQEDE